MIKNRKYILIISTVSLLTLTTAAQSSQLIDKTPQVEIDYQTLNLNPTPNLWDCSRTSLSKDLAKHHSARDRYITKPVLIEKDTVLNQPSQSFAAYEDFSTLQQCVIQIGSPGLALGDVDNDGRTDIVKASTLLLNKKSKWHAVPLENTDSTTIKELQPSSRFAQQWTGTPVIADLDNDYSSEIIIQRETELTTAPFEIYSNQNNKWVNQTFYRGISTTKSFQRGVALTVADINRDGWLDIILGRRLTITESAYNQRIETHPTPISLWINNGSSNPGTFTDQTESYGIRSAFTQLNLPDRLRGFNSTFQEYVALTQSILASDIDNNGFQDILVMGDGGQSALLLNKDGKNFTPALNFPPGPSAMGAATLDIDKNGLLDIFISNIHSNEYTFYHCPSARPCDTSKIGNQLLLQTSPGVFVDQAEKYNLLNSGWSWGAAFADLLNNANPLLVVANGYGPSQSPRYEGWKWRIGETKLFIKEKNKYLDIAKDINLKINDATAAVQVDDINKDGKLDLVISSFRYRQPILVNNVTKNTGNFISIKVNGLGANATNYDGIGAVLTLKSPNTHQKQEITTNSTFTSNGANTKWFGIGKDKTAIVEVYFPATNRKVTKELTANKLYTITEPIS